MTALVASSNKKVAWVLVIALASALVVAGALLTLSVLETNEYDRDAYSIGR